MRQLTPEQRSGGRAPRRLPARAGGRRHRQDDGAGRALRGGGGRGRSGRSTSVLAITFTEKAAAEMKSARAAALPRARPPRGRARRRERLGLDDPRLLRAHAPRPRAERRHRPRLPGARRARGASASPPTRSTARSRTFMGEGDPDRLELVAAYTPDRLRRHGAHRLLAPAQPRRAPPAAGGDAEPPPASRRRGGRGCDAPPWRRWRELVVAAGGDREGRARAVASGSQRAADQRIAGTPRGNAKALAARRLRGVPRGAGGLPARSRWRAPRAPRPHLLRVLLELYGERYASAKRERSALDFEDLELLARDLLRRDEGLREAYSARFEHVLVDEFQDTNRLQNELLGLLAARQPVPRRRREPVDLPLPARRRRACSASTGRRLSAAGRAESITVNFRITRRGARRDRPRVRARLGRELRAAPRGARVAQAGGARAALRGPPRWWTGPVTPGRR